MVIGGSVVFRTDASSFIGTGHVMRCLTLANGLRAKGMESHFICREHDGHLCDLIEQHGYAVKRLAVDGMADKLVASSGYAAWLGAPWQQDAQESCRAVEALGRRPELLVVDHYALDERWERALRPMVKRILVIDDLADRRHSCDVLLDQNLHDSPDTRYVGLVDSFTRVFVGPQYALLRPEFHAVSARVRESGLRRILAYFGGADPSGQSSKLLSALLSLRPEVPQTTLVLGFGNPGASQVRKIAEGLDGISVVDTTNRMAELMMQADLGIGTCGGAAWERCVVGLPALVVVGAENQRDDARILHEKGAVRNLGDAESVDVACWIEAIRTLKRDSKSLSAMSRAAAAVMCDRWDVDRLLEAVL